MTKPTFSFPALSSISVTHICMHRILRVGSCPVLEVSVSYPLLCAGEVDESMLPPSWHRFCETYRNMAEKVMAWAQSNFFESVVTAFSAQGAMATYGFDRRMLICDMRVTNLPTREGADSENLIVTRSLQATSRRGEAAQPTLKAEDIWRWPELTICPPPGRKTLLKKSGNWQKTIEI